MVTQPTAQFDPGSLGRSEPDYRFDFCGGQLAIDFTNTVGDRGSISQEHFATIGDIAAWAEARQIVDRTTLQELRRWVQAHASAARREYVRALEVREALYRTFLAVASNRPVGDHDLDLVNREVSLTNCRTHLSFEDGQFTLSSAGRHDNPVDEILEPILRAAVSLMTSGELRNVRVCADPACAWLFLDTSRNRSRRWCDMRACGNRQKIRRFRARRV
jgi:predicted RNA-binding Zn ribbon-like protein